MIDRAELCEAETPAVDRPEMTSRRLPSYSTAKDCGARGTCRSEKSSHRGGTATCTSSIGIKPKRLDFSTNGFRGKRRYDTKPSR